jgi:hypothetical protein
VAPARSRPQLMFVEDLVLACIARRAGRSRPRWSWRTEWESWNRRVPRRPSALLPTGSSWRSATGITLAQQHHQALDVDQALCRSRRPLPAWLGVPLLVMSADRDDM